MTALRRVIGTALFLLAPSTLPAQAGTVVLGSVEDSLGTPIRDVQIFAVGTDVRATSDAMGRFRLLDLPRGSYLLRVRRLGFEPVMVRVELPFADGSPLSIELRESAADLAPVVVRTDGISPRLAETGFENRRQFSGAPPTQFVTRADFDRVQPIDLTQMLRRMSGRAARCGDGVVFLDGTLLTKPVADALPSASPTTTSLMYSPDAATAGSAARRAVQEIAKTGVAAPKPMALDLVPQNWIEGMEVYSSPAQIPNEFRAAFREARCVILLWTR